MNVPQLFPKRFLIVLAVGVMLAGTLFLTIPTRAATLTVAAGVVEIDDNDGQCSLIEAIVNANDDAATHPDCPAGNGADVIELASGATYGAANNNYVGTALPTITDELIIEGNNATLAQTSTTGNFRLTKNGAGNGLTIRDLTLEDGQTQSSGGGAISNLGRLTINRSVFRGNSTLLSGIDGGAIYSSGVNASLTVLNSTFDNNSAFGYGGAIHASGGGAIRLINNTFTGNSAPNGGRGGAIHYDGVDGALLEIRSTFTGNESYNNGGAIYITSAVSDSSIAYSTFDANESTNGGGGVVDVGGIYF